MAIKSKNQGKLSEPVVMAYLTGVALVLTAGICWSVIPTFVKKFEAAGTWQILFYRSFGVLPLIYFLCARQSKQGVWTEIKNSGWVGIVGGMGLVMAYAGGIASVRITSIANAAFLFATAPFMAAIMARTILKESIRPSTIWALCLALLGIAIMVSGNFSQGKWWGDVLALCSALGFAIFTTALRVGREQNTLPLIMLGSLFSIVTSALIILLTQSGFYLPWQEVVLALAIGFFALGVGMFLYSLGSKVVPAAELALLCMTEVLLAPVWAWLFLREVPEPGVILGGTILILAIIYNALTGMRRKPVPVTF